MKSFTQIVLLLSTFFLSSNVLAQTRQPRVPDCSVGVIEVVTSNGVVQVRTGGRTLDLFGRTVQADDLIGIVSTRLTTTAEPKFNCDDEMLRTAGYLLAEAEDARVLEPLLEVSKSSCPNSCASAVFSLRRLGDRRALPRLLEILRKGDACAWAAVLAVAKIGDETAIKDLINTITSGGGMEAEARLKAIEEITGLSLDGIRDKWGLLYYGKLKEFHKAMHEWWDAHRHLAKIKDIGSKNN